MRELYEKIKEKIRQDVPEINCIEFWNNQFASMEDREHPVYRFPLCFIGFDIPIEWVTKSSGVQETEGLEVTVWISKEYYNTSESEYDSLDLDFFDLTQKVFGALQGYNGDGAFATLNRVREEPDNDHNSYIVFKQTYTTKLVDSSGVTDLNTIGSLDLRVDGDLIIENDRIRTARQ